MNNELRTTNNEQISGLEFRADSEGLLLSYWQYKISGLMLITVEH